MQGRPSFDHLSPGLVDFVDVRPCDVVVGDLVGFGCGRPFVADFLLSFAVEAFQMLPSSLLVLQTHPPLAPVLPLLELFEPAFPPSFAPSIPLPKASFLLWQEQMENSLVSKRLLVVVGPLAFGVVACLKRWWGWWGWRGSEGQQRPQEQRALVRK